MNFNEFSMYLFRWKGGGVHYCMYTEQKKKGIILVV